MSDTTWTDLVKDVVVTVAYAHEEWDCYVQVVHINNVMLLVNRLTEADRLLDVAREALIKACSSGHRKHLFVDEYIYTCCQVFVTGPHSTNCFINNALKELNAEKEKRT